MYVYVCSDHDDDDAIAAAIVCISFSRTVFWLQNMSTMKHAPKHAYAYTCVYTDTHTHMT